jgi:hypothetical protein
MSASLRARLQHSPVLLALLVAYLLADITGVAMRTWQDLYEVGDSGYPDSANLFRIAQLAHGMELYPDLDKPPYLPTIYGPLFYTLMTIAYRMAEAFGFPLTVTLRLAVLLFFLLCMLLVFRLGKALTGAVGPAWLAVLLAGSGSFLSGWTVQLRPDFMGLAFALFCVALCMHSHSRFTAPLAGLSAGVGLLCKQTFVAAPSACTLWLLWRRQYTKAAQLAGVTLSVTLAGYAFFGWSEPAAWQHLKIFRSPLNDDVGAIHLLARAATRPSIPLFLLGFGLLWNQRACARGGLLIYVVMAWLIAALTARQIGANDNYFFEPLLASVPLSAVAVWRLHELRQRAPIWVTIGAALLLAPLMAGTWLNNLELMRTTSRESAVRSDRLQRWREFRAALEGKLVLSAFPETAVWSARPEFLDPYLNHVLERTERWSPAPILGDLRRQTYDVVMLPMEMPQYRGLDLLSKPIQAAIERFYVPYCTWRGASRRTAWGQGVMILVPKLERPGHVALKHALVQAGCHVEVEKPEGS